MLFIHNSMSNLCRHFNLSLLPFAFYSRLLPELQNRFKSVYNPPNLLNFTFDKKTILDFKIMR